MDLSVVIISANSRLLLEPCLRSVQESGSSLAYEVIVVNNGCTDGTAEMVRRLFLQVRLLRHEGSWGFAKNNNYGIAHSQGRYILLLNADTLVQPGVLGELVRFMDEHPQVGLAGPKLLNPDGTLQHSAHCFSTVPILLMRGLYLDKVLWKTPFMRAYMMWDWDHDEARPVDMVIGAAMVVRREAMEQVGLLDERFGMYFEDQDLCLRMWRVGWQVYYVPSARIVHLYPRSSAKRPFSKMWRQHVASMLYFLWKHYLRRGGLGEAFRGPQVRGPRRG